MASNPDTTVLETILPPALLEKAFARFTEASERLETQYSALLQETEVLREQVREKDLAIKRAEKLALLGETAAAIAHEVRNPLGAMRLFVSLLEQDLAGKPESLKILSHIDQSISTLDHVVSNILQFAKKTSATMAPVHVHSIIREQVEHFTLSPRSAAITLDFQGSPFIQGNEHALRQVFFNVLLNAQQATRYQGRIDVSCRSLSTGDLEIRIHDDGPGIEEAVLQKLFEPFTTTKNEGTGLGLAVVRQIVEDHKGQVSALNEGGATFVLRFPQSKPV